MLRKLFFIVALCSVTLYGCAVNPVTGKRQLELVTESQELQIGSQQFLPSRQMQGGDYVIDPELTKYVNDVGQRLAAVSDRKLPYEFVVLNNSIPNAWALPGGKIAVNRGLLTELHNEAELAAVLGHEVVHAAARHGAQSMERGLLLQGAIAIAGIATRGSNYENLAVRGAQVAAGLITQKYGRNAESEADRYGMEYMSRAGYDPRAAISLQELFVKLSEGKETDWLSGLFASHPPSAERLEANRTIAKTLPESGELGAQRYKEKIVRLIQTKDAYEAFDMGNKKLSEGNVSEALSLAKKAIRNEPEEGRFYALLGDVYMKQQQYQNALASYNEAVEHNSEFFYFYVQRGLDKQKLGDQQGARSDLEKSTKLLPTATALNALGNMSLAQGNLPEALQYFKDASVSPSEPGREAARSFVRLDMHDHPDNHIKARINQNHERKVIITIVNPAPLPVRDVTVLIRYRDEQGKMVEVTRNVHEILFPGKSTNVDTGIGPVKNAGMLRHMSVNVIKADVAE